VPPSVDRSINTSTSPEGVDAFVDKLAFTLPFSPIAVELFTVRMTCDDPAEMLDELLAVCSVAWDTPPDPSPENGFTSTVISPESIDTPVLLTATSL
jgi:hypothetical protein